MVPKSRDAYFAPAFLEDFRFWVETDRKAAIRLLGLVDAVLRDPFQGIGKPKPLKHFAPGVWSRRLTLRDRFVYRVPDARTHFLQGRYHY